MRGEIFFFSAKTNKDRKQTRWMPASIHVTVNTACEQPMFLKDSDFTIRKQAW